MTASLKRFLAALLIVLVQFIFISPQKAYAATAPDLGVADSYAVFGKAGVTNDEGGTTHIWGNVGADYMNTITHLISGQVGGSIIAPADGIQTAASSAYDTLMLGTQGTPAPLDLAGTHTIGPGVYDIAASTLNGVLTLDGAGVYIFRSSSSETTVASGTMNLINGACASNVFWAISNSMTIGAGAHVEGTIIASTGLISLGSGTTLIGRAISLTKQVTLLLNQITQPICVAPAPTPPTCVGEEHLDASGTICVNFSPSGPPQSGGTTSTTTTTTTTSTGQVLGASTLASTGSFNSIAGLALMIAGSVMTLGSLYAFKKKVI